VQRWARSHGRVGVSAPSWLTFEVHRPYFDGAQTPRTAVQARGPVVAARLFAARDTTTPRLSMTMPASYRWLLVEESRLPEYRIGLPTELPAALASPDWTSMAAAFARHCDLDAVDRAGLAQWLVATCLHDAVLVLAPRDHTPEQCADPATATVQAARAVALFLREGLSGRALAAREPLLAATVPTPAQLGAVGGWAHLTARHDADDSAVTALAARTRELYAALAPDMRPFERHVRWARLLMRETTHAERHGAYDHAADLLAEAESAAGAAVAGTPEEETVGIELRRRLIDRGVEIAVRRGDGDTERRLIAEGLALDPYCVKIRMQAAQAAERRGEHADALAGYLLAARLGPFGTAYALLGAARCADRPAAARALRERALRAAPRSARVREALLAACADDEPLASVVRRTAPRSGAPAYENNWHYQMYAAYFNLGESRSPCMYARLPLITYEAARSGAGHRIGYQRIMPPAFRGNLIRESGLAEFAVRHPADLPKELWTPAWADLCDRTAELASAGPAPADLERQLQTVQVLFRVGFHRLVLDLVPDRPADRLASPAEVKLQAMRDIVGYTGAVGSRHPGTPMRAIGLVDHPHCPLHMRLWLSTWAVVHHGRETKSLDDAVAWRARAQEYLDAVLRGDDHTPFEKTILESRFYRGVSFVPFMRRDHEAVVAELDRAEELARSVPASSPWEEFLKRENLHACLESRSKEAFGLGDIALGQRRTEEFLALDPYDPKSHIEYGESLLREERHLEAAEAYLTAARLGPLGTAIAYAMAGECFERAGEPVLAEDCFVQSLRVDPYAISAARGWRRVATDDGLAAGYAGDLEAWGAARR